MLLNLELLDQFWQGIASLLVDSGTLRVLRVHMDRLRDLWHTDGLLGPMIVCPSPGIFLVRRSTDEGHILGLIKIRRICLSLIIFYPISKSCTRLDILTKNVLNTLKALKNWPWKVIEWHFRQVLRIVGEVKHVYVEPNDDRRHFTIWKAKS